MGEAIEVVCWFGGLPVRRGSMEYFGHAGEGGGSSKHCFCS